MTQHLVARHIPLVLLKIVQLLIELSKYARISLKKHYSSQRSQILPELVSRVWATEMVRYSLILCIVVNATTNIQSCNRFMMITL